MKNEIKAKNEIKVKAPIKQYWFLVVVICLLAIAAFFFYQPKIQLGTPKTPSKQALAKPNVPSSELNQCKVHADCGPTCCGCYNQKYFEYCNKTCDRNKLKTCECKDGICVPSQ